MGRLLRQYVNFCDESEVLGCGSKTTCSGANWDMPEGSTCRTHREYTSASDHCGRGSCTPGWTTYTGGTCNSRSCIGATVSSFTPDNPEPKEGVDGVAIFLFVIGCTLIQLLVFVVRTLVEVNRNPMPSTIALLFLITEYYISINTNAMTIRPYKRPSIHEKELFGRKISINKLQIAKMTITITFGSFNIRINTGKEQFLK